MGPHISGTVEAKNCKFGTHIDHRGTNEKNAKLGQEGPRKGHVTYISNFGTPSISRERSELETSNLAGIFNRGRGTNERNVKFGQRRSGRGHVTYFSNFGSLSTSRERLKLETLACRLTTRGTNEKNTKFCQRGPGRGHVTYF